MIDDSLIELWCLLAFKTELTEQELLVCDNISNIILKHLEKQYD